MTTEQTQHARDSAELRRLCSERDQLREKVAEQAREIERLSKPYIQIRAQLEQEWCQLRALQDAVKAQPGGVVRWPEADEIMQMAFEEGQPSEDASGYYFELEEFDLFIQRLMEEVARLNQPASAALSANHSERVPELSSFVAFADALGLDLRQSDDQWNSALELYEKLIAAYPQPSADLSVPTHGEQVRNMVPDGWNVERGCSPSGYVLHSPGGSMIRVCDSGMGGIETAFAMFLKAMLAAAPSAGSQGGDV